MKMCSELQDLLEYLYEGQNKRGEIYCSLSDIVLMCDFYIGKTKEENYNILKNVLIDLCGNVLQDWCLETLSVVDTSKSNELIILELNDKLK